MTTTPTLLRRSLAALAGATLFVTACGGSDVPTKAEFTSKIKKSIGADVEGSLSGTGVDAKTTTKIVDDFIGCVYDEIKDNEELLTSAYEDQGSDKIQSDLEKNAKKCTDAMTKTITKALTGG